MPPVYWEPSADKHGIDLDDASHAILNAVRYESEYVNPRYQADPPPSLWIGPQRRPGEPLLEVLAHVRSDRTLHVFHVMIATPETLSLIGREEPQ